ncbi:DNA polymerase III, delta subunit [Fervidobacterium changbaicum]|uniref:DNA polymerase III subunit delta n=2 Tax=Fervidobacterium TaxID=2422 RepID=A0AAI8CIG3_FERIS|nr:MULTISPECIES: DNA polymerase III subunit delta [Fervidobacterium]AMW32112.1 DNA polymerase III subunit delta [Fervidobacterium islandicum]QAV33884.1 DNA polymerase III subunit delta [Fervidobacterium changbaicum]SDH73643.1 DNA polymerase III, delta subunit [Fervidobacterium changbaicum]
MVVYLTGDSQLGKELYIREYLKGKDVEYHKIYADDDNKIEELKNAGVSLGLFANAKVYDLVDFDEWSKDEKTQFYSTDLSASWVTVFVRTEKVSKEVTKLPGKVEVLTFEKPKEWEEDKWLKFISDVASKIGIVCSEETAKAVFKFTGPDEYAILNELEKLQLYAGDHPTPRDVEDVVYKRTISRLDEFCFALSEQNYTKANDMLDEISKDYEPIIVSYAISKHFIELLNIVVFAPKKKEYKWPDIANLSKELGISSPRAARFLGFSFKDSKYTPVNHVLIYSPQMLRNIIGYLYYIDRRVKLSDDIKILVSSFITKLASGEFARTFEEDTQQAEDSGQVNQ